MAEEKVKTWIPKFQEELKLGSGFAVIYEKVLQADKKNIEPNNPSYPAAVAYITNLLLRTGKSQKEVAAIARCSVQDMRDQYRAIVGRNRKEIIDLSF